jgi:hypothetical protein
MATSMVVFDDNKRKAEEVDLRIDVWKRARASAKTLAANQALAAKRQGSKGDRTDKQTRKRTQIKHHPPAIRFPLMQGSARSPSPNRSPFSAARI